MTLDEAIKHCEEKAKELSDKAYSEYGKSMTEEEAYDCNECAREHEQLAKWLKELKAYKESSKGDLISREALKKCAIPCEIHNGALTDLCVPLYQIDNAPTVTERPIRCKDCKYQKKYWHEDKRMKEGGYWVYNCYFICDPLESGPVSGEPEEYCSSAEQKGGAE